MLSKEEAIRRIKEIPIDELREMCRKAAEEAGLTLEDALATDWDELCEKIRRHEI